MSSNHVAFQSILLIAFVVPSTVVAAATSTGPIVICGAGGRVLAWNADAGLVRLSRTQEPLVIANSIAAGPGLSCREDRAYVALPDHVNLPGPPIGDPIKSVHIGLAPQAIVVSPDGKRAYVSDSARSVVEVVDLTTGKTVHTLAMPESPFAIAMAASGDSLIVTHLKGRTVSIINAASLAVMEVPMRSILFDPDNTIVPAGTASRMKGVAIHPTRNEAWLPHVLANEGNFVQTVGNTTVFPAITVLDLDSDPPRVSALLTLYSGFSTPAGNPEAVAFSPDGKLAYVTAFASNHLLIFDVEERREIASISNVGDGPYGIDVTPDGKFAYIVNRLSPTVTVVDLMARKVSETISLPAEPVAEAITNGRRFFFSSALPETSEGMASCESCHIEGRDDGRTWFFDFGPRQTHSLAGGTLHTGLLHHNGDHANVQAFQTTFTNLQGGKGLSDAQLDELAAFVHTIPHLPNPHLAPDGSMTDAARRGRRLFYGEAGCGGCHSGPYFTDATDHDDPKQPLLHNVGIFAEGSGAKDEFVKTRDQIGRDADPPRPAGWFETTSLLGVWATPPYLHDGRAATLRDVLTTHNLENRHGRTSQLATTQLDDLVAFLEQIDLSNSRIGIVTPEDGSKVLRLSAVTGTVLAEVERVEVHVGEHVIPAKIDDRRFRAVIPARIAAALSASSAIAISARARTVSGEQGRDDVSIVLGGAKQGGEAR